MYRFLAPVLSAQFITAPHGRPSEMRYLLPEAPARPRLLMASVASKEPHVLCVTH